MKLIDILPLCVAAAMFCACSDNTNEAADISAITTMDSATFFQVSEEIQTETPDLETEKTDESCEK